MSAIKVTAIFHRVADELNWHDIDYFAIWTD